MEYRGIILSLKGFSVDIALGLSNDCKRPCESLMRAEALLTAFSTADAGMSVVKYSFNSRHGQRFNMHRYASRTGNSPRFSRMRWRWWRRDRGELVKLQK